MTRILSILCLLCLATSHAGQRPPQSLSGWSITSSNSSQLILQGSGGTWAIVGEDPAAEIAGEERPPEPEPAPPIVSDGTLRYAVWTNFVARTNNKTTAIWTSYGHVAGWPTNPPSFTWNTNGFLFGKRGFTAISQCNEFEGPPGQVPVTLITRRHGYMRGHSTGPCEVIRTNRAGQKVFFVSSNNTIVTATVAADFGRNKYAGAGDPVGTNDWSIVLFTEDVPETITPVRVISRSDFAAHFPSSTSNVFLFPTHYPSFACGAQSAPTSSSPFPQFYVSAYNVGDSGYGQFIPMPDEELIFVAGRSTDGPSEVMQADIDLLSDWAGLNTNSYQLDYIDVSGYTLP